LLGACGTFDLQRSGTTPDKILGTRKWAESGQQERQGREKHAGGRRPIQVPATGRRFRLREPRLRREFFARGLDRHALVRRTNAEEPMFSCATRIDLSLERPRRLDAAKPVRQSRARETETAQVITRCRPDDRGANPAVTPCFRREFGDESAHRWRREAGECLCTLIVQSE